MNALRRSITHEWAPVAIDGAIKPLISVILQHNRESGGWGTRSLSQFHGTNFIKRLQLPE